MRYKQLLYIIAALAALLPAVSAPAALFLGIAVALTVGNPFLARTRAATKTLLSISIVALGAGMDLNAVLRAGSSGMLATALGIAFALFAGLALGRALGTPPDASLLISAGTAICGGSAIAAVARAIRADERDTSVALATVFVLNAIALFVFPWIGHAAGLSEARFGLWCALAIHDTSSVVGATLQYGPRALQVGTTVKLARALWIVPLTFGIARMRARSTGRGGATVPWFILGFVLAAALFTAVPQLAPLGHWIELAGRRGLVLTLFLIGSGLTLRTLREVGARPFVQGALLWVAVATAGWGIAAYMAPV